MSAAQPPLLQQQQLQQQAIQQMQQPLLPHDTGAGGDGGRVFLPPHPSQASPMLPAAAVSSSAQHVHVQPQQQSLFARPGEFLPQQHLLYPQQLQQQPLLQPLQTAPPVAASAAGGGPSRSTTGSSNSSVTAPPPRATPAAAPATPATCNQIQVEPRHVLQLLRQLIDENPESFKRFQVRPDMPPRAVHQLLRELEEARLIKQQEVLRRAHALALQQKQQQQTDGGSGSLSPASSACATPPLGGAAAGRRQQQQQEGGRRSRGQQQQQPQQQQAAGGGDGEPAESEKRKKKKKKAVFPEGPGGWGPEARSSSNAAAAAAAATAAAAAPPAAALSHASQSQFKTLADVSRALTLLPTLSHDKQVELLVELLAVPEGFARVQELKDAGRLSSASVQQALRQFRQQQQQQQKLLLASSGAAGRGREAATSRDNEAAGAAAGHSRAAAGYSGALGMEGGRASGDSSRAAVTHAPGQLGSLVAAEQKWPPAVKLMHSWTCREDAWAAAAAAAAAAGGAGSPPAGIAAAEDTAAAEAAEFAGGWRGDAFFFGDFNKTSTSTRWLGAVTVAGGHVLLRSAYFLQRPGAAATTSVPYSGEAAAEALFSFPTAAAAGSEFTQGDRDCYYGRGDEAATGEEAASATAHSSLLLQRQAQRILPQQQFSRSGSVQQQRQQTLLLLQESIGSSTTPAGGLTYLPAGRTAIYGTPGAAAASGAGERLAAAAELVALKSSSSSSRERSLRATAPLFPNSSNNALWKAAAASGGVSERDRARVDPAAALLFYGRGVPSSADGQPFPAAAARKREFSSSRQLSKLDMYIQRLVELTMRRLGAVYGRRLFLTDEAETRSILKQALKDRLRAIAPSLCALAEYRAERHLQRLMAAAAADAEPRSKGLEDGEDGEGSTPLGGSSMGGRVTDSVQQQQHFYSSSALLDGQEHQQRQQFVQSRKRSHADLWRSHTAAAAAGGYSGETLLWRREKATGKSRLRRVAVRQRFDELHALFMQKENDKLLVEHLRRLQEQQRRGKAGRVKNKGILATDSSVQSAPFIRNADDAREAQDGMGAEQQANTLSVHESATEAAAAAAFAYLEKQALLLNGSSISSEADAQLALVSAQLQLELRQRQLAEVAEEKAIEFAKVAHSQRLLLLKATALDFRTFLHTKTAAAFFPMRFRERLLQYVEAVHFDLQSPPPRIPRNMLPVAPPAADVAAAAAAAARSAAASFKGAAGPPERAEAEKSFITSSSGSSFVASSGGPSAAALSRNGTSAKSSTPPAEALAAPGEFPGSPGSAAPAAAAEAKSSATVSAVAAKEERAVAASGTSLSSPSTTITTATITKQGASPPTTIPQLASEVGGRLSHHVYGSAAGNVGESAAGSVAADEGSAVTGKKSGVLKAAKPRVRKKVSASTSGTGKGTAWPPLGDGGEETAGGKAVGTAESHPGTGRGGGVRGKSGSSRETVSGVGASGSGRVLQQDLNSLPSAGHVNVGAVARRNYGLDAPGLSVPDASSYSVIADSRQLLGGQQEARTTTFPSGGESLAELFRIPTVAATDGTRAQEGAGESTGVQLKTDTSSRSSRQSSGGSLLNTSSTRGGSGDVIQSRQPQAGTGYAAAGAAAQWGGGVVVAGSAAARDALSRQHPQQVLHQQQGKEHRQKSGQLVQQGEGSAVAANGYTNEQLGGFAAATDELPSAFGMVSAAGSSADVVIPELEGEGEEDCL